MKKILLASTILAGTAGFAAADNANFTFSGEAYMGIAASWNWDEAVGQDIDGDGVTGEADVTRFTPEVTAEFSAAMMTTTDGGLEAGTKITVETRGLSMEDDHTDGGFGTVTADSAATVSRAEVWLSGDWGKFTMEYEGVSAGNPEFGDVDFEYAHSFGDFSIEAWYEYRWGPDNDDYGLEGKYSFGDYAVWLGYEHQEAVNDYEAWVGASAALNGFSGEVEATYVSVADDWDFYAEANYTIDAFTFGAFIEDDGTDDDWDYGVNASYDLGGGVSVDGAYIFDNDATVDGVSMAKVGVAMKF